MSQMGETIQTGDNEAREGFASRTSIFISCFPFCIPSSSYRAYTFGVCETLTESAKAVIDILRSIAMHRDQHKVVDCSVGVQSASDNLTPIVNGGGEQGIQVPVGASRKECG